MKLNDPKLGYSWMWLFPIGIIYELALHIKEFFRRGLHFLKIRYAHFRNRKLKHLEKLAGIRDE